MQGTAQKDKAVKALDVLIADLGGADHGLQTPGPSGLLLEHLQTARCDLLGSMRAEYGLSLQQAKGSLACVPDKGKRAKMKSALRALIDEAAEKSGN